MKRSWTFKVQNLLPTLFPFTSLITLSMKNFFEFFGFLSTACISAALIFIFIGGKKDGLRTDSKGGFLTEMGAGTDLEDAPRTISDHPMRSSGISSSKKIKNSAAPASADMAPEERLKSLYQDEAFVSATAKQWKGLVQDAADEYNVKPQVLLAHVLVQSYLNEEYSRTQLYNDAARHAGERVKPVATAIKGYRYSWSMQKLIGEHDLMRYFPNETSVPTAAASIGTNRKTTEKMMSAKGLAKTTAPMAKTDPVEEGFKNMVAKEYGFGSWAGMSKLADPDTKAEAARRVKSLMMASRVR